MNISFTLNGRAAAAEVAADETLVEMLRDRLQLTALRDADFELLRSALDKEQ